MEVDPELRLAQIVRIRVLQLGSSPGSSSLSPRADLIGLASQTTFDFGDVWFHFLNMFLEAFLLSCE